MPEYAQVGIVFMALVFAGGRAMYLDRFSFDGAVACGVSGVVGAIAAYAVCCIAGLAP